MKDLKDPKIIKFYCELVGIPINKNCRCPFHDEDGTESKLETFRYVKGRKRAQCYSTHCNSKYGIEGPECRNFDVIDLIRLYEGFNYKEAVEFAQQLKNHINEGEIKNG